jgi:hypothetical protein
VANLLAEYPLRVYGSYEEIPYGGTAA